MEAFRIQPGVELSFESDSEASESCRESIYLCEDLIEKCRNVIRDRRTAKVLETFREKISEYARLLRVHEKQIQDAKDKKAAEEEKRKKDSNNKRTAPLTSQSEASETEDPEEESQTQ